MKKILAIIIFTFMCFFVVNVKYVSAATQECEYLFGKVKIDYDKKEITFPGYNRVDDYISDSVKNYFFSDSNNKECKQLYYYERFINNMYRYGVFLTKNECETKLTQNKDEHSVLYQYVKCETSFSSSKLPTQCSYFDSSAAFHSSDPGIYYEFKINDAASTHSIHSKNSKKTNDEKIQNWDEIKAIDFSGKDYVYSKKACPPYVLITHSNTGYNVFVSDKKCSSYESALKKYYSTLDKCYTLEPSNNLSDDNKKEKDKQNLEDASKSCLAWTNDEDGCTHNGRFSCLWISGGGSPGYCNTDDLQYIKCGGAFDIPEQAPRIMSFAINLLKIGTPIILIITGIITLVKAVAASKEDDMKKAQSTLIRKAVAAALVFFVISIVQFVLLSVADSGDESSISNCLSCFMNNDCDSNVYYKTKVLDKYECHLVSNPSKAIKCGEDE